MTFPVPIGFADHVTRGHQTLVINGLGRTTEGIENISIPVTIVSAFYVTVVELVGSVLVPAGALITVVAAHYLIVMIRAAEFVHIPHGIFAAVDGGELVGAITALLLVLAAAGPARWILDHRLDTRQGTVPAPSRAASAPPCRCQQPRRPPRVGPARPCRGPAQRRRGRGTALADEQGMPVAAPARYRGDADAAGPPPRRAAPSPPKGIG